MKPKFFLFTFLLLPLSSNFLLLIAAAINAHPPPSYSPPANSLLLSDSTSLLAFKSKADFGHKLITFSPNTTTTSSSAHCKWQGVTCRQARVVRLVLQGLPLLGVFAPDTLTRLDQLRVLSLQNDSLTGPVPDLSGLVNLKALFLDHNSFSGPIPPSISTLHRIRTVDLSFNLFAGSLPSSLNNLDRLYCLRLESNRLSGSIPPLNQTSLQVLNVSINKLTGAVPVTPTLLRFGPSSFSLNPRLCGEIVNAECPPNVPFFRHSPAVAQPSPPVSLGQNQQLQEGVDLTHPSSNKRKRAAVIVGFSSGAFLLLIGSVICLAMAVKRHRTRKGLTTPIMASDTGAAADAAAVMRIEEENELEEKVKKKVEGINNYHQAVGRSGSLVFCAGEAQIYTLEQLMRASAELLGKGTMGSTYKAVLDNRLIVTVKRMDAGRLAGTGREEFERHMGSVGGLRHPNLVPLRAYFQANEERLLVYDYQPNGSLFSLIHGKPCFYTLRRLTRFH